MALLTAACSSADVCGDAVLAPQPRPERFAYIASDFMSSSLGLLDVEGIPTGPPLVTSGSTAPGALTALSGDVVLATSQPSDRLLYVERLGADLITDLDRDAWFIRQQSRVSPISETGTTFSANPQDMLALDEDRFWVTRHNPNTEMGVPMQGNDIVIVRRPDGQIERPINLVNANTLVDGETIYARPARMVLVADPNAPDQDTVVVGLARLSEDFMVAAPGAIALVDVRSAIVSTTLSLAPLTNCAEVRPVIDMPSHVLVVCAGTTFQTPEVRRATSGVALIDVSRRQVLRLWKALDHPEFLPPQYGLVSLGGEWLVVVGLSEGDMATTVESQLLLIDLSNNRTQVIAASSGEGLGFGAGAFDPETRTLLVGDAHLPGIRRFDRVNEVSFLERSLPHTVDCANLAVREIALLSRPSGG